MRAAACFLALGVGVLGAATAMAGGVAIQNYLLDGGRNILSMPVIYFDHEFQAITGLNRDDMPVQRQPRSREELHQTTVRTDIAEVAAALEGRDGADALVAAYREARHALRDHALAHFEALARRHAYQPRPVPEPFDIRPYLDSLAGIPDEFTLYLQGAAAYHNEDWETAVARFEEVLALPAEDRRHRSTWAAFSIGMALLRANPGEAGPYFDMTQHLAADGFPDALGLAETSPGWHARASYLAGDHLDAIHRYAALEVYAGDSMRLVCIRALADDDALPALAEDPLARELLTAQLLSYSYPGPRANPWLDAVEAAVNDAPIAYADRIAWVHYKQGRMEDAKRWANLAPEDSIYTKWVRAKLHLYDGNFDEGYALMESLSEKLPPNGESSMRAPGYFAYDYTPRQIALADLGYLRLREGNYEGALLAFLEANLGGDAHYIAERVLYPKELADFLEKHKASPLWEPATQWGHWMPRPSYASLQHMLARRWAREGDWETAAAVLRSIDAEYLQDGWYDRISPEAAADLADEVGEHLARATDERLAPEMRAEHYAAAARILRDHGPAIYNAQLIAHQGVLEPAEPGFPPDLAERIERNMAAYPRMNHFRWQAAEWIWQAARLWPDNDARTAKALWTGGTWIMHRDPEGADRFYKALVRRNPNLLIGQQADELRWFPREFTDAVLYTPRIPEPWLARKRNQAIVAAAMAAAVLIIALAAALWERHAERLRLG